MTEYKSTAQHSKEIRQELKRRHGWNSRQVSVITDTYSMGSSIRIAIKNPGVPISKVKAVADEHERIDRDGWGNILSGGNRFVFVDYSYEARQELGRPYVAELEALPVEPNGGTLYPVKGRLSKPLAYVGRHGNDTFPEFRVSFTTPESDVGTIQPINGLEHAAFQIGLHALECGS